MKTIGMYRVNQQIIVYQIFAFCLIIIFIWLNEVIDLPHILFGAEATPINWLESLYESIGIGLLAILVTLYTGKLLKRVKYLEGIVPVCASCKRIRDEAGNWRQFESYIGARTQAEFSHGICPECMEKLYPEYKPKV